MDEKRQDIQTCPVPVPGPDGVHRPCGLPCVPGQPACETHVGILRTGRGPTRAGRYSHWFKTQTLREAYERLRADPELTDMSDELALSRVLLAAVLAKLDATKELTDLSAGEKAELMAMLDQVGKTADAMAKMERTMQTTVSAAQLARVVEQAARLFYQELDGLIALVRNDVNARELRARVPEVLHRIADGLRDLELPFNPERWAKDVARRRDEGDDAGYTGPGP
jgi:hypothetical protein